MKWRPFMWQVTHETAASVDPAAVWRLWSDVATWAQWNPDVREASIDGDFAAGATIRMTLRDGTVVALTLADVVAGESFTDRAEFDGLILSTEHRIEESGQRLVYALTVTGEAPEPVQAEVGGAVSADWPDTLAALVHAAGA